MAYFSIIIPVYNIKDYLPECLESILEQSFTDWECLVVDDGSTDSTDAIADGYAVKDIRIKVIHQLNHGVSAARNRALEEVSGQWLCFVDGDDFIHPETLQRCFHAINNNPASNLVLFNHLFSEKPAFSPLGVIQWFSISIADSIPPNIWNNGLWGAVYRREFIGKRRFLPFSFAEDTFFMRQCLLNAAEVTYLPDVLYAYRKRPGSAMTSLMTMKKLVDGYDSYSELALCLSSCGKHLSEKCYKDIWRNLFEWPVLRLNDLAQSVEKESFLKYWMRKNKEICCKIKVPARYSLRFYLSSFLHFRCCVFLLMAFPLKTLIYLSCFRDYIHGINRI